MATYLGNRRTYCLLSGSSTPNEYNDLRFQAHFYLESQNVANNTSTVRVDYVLEKWGTNAYGQTTCRATIDGTAKQKQIANVYWGYPAGTHNLGNEYFTVSHDASGNKTLTVYGWLQGNPDYEGYTSKSFTFSCSLPQISQGTTINTFNLDKVNLTSLKITWATAHNVSQVQYSLNGGGWTMGWTGNAKSGNFNLTNLSPNTQYSVKIRVRRQDSQLWTESSAKNATTVDIARITSAPDNIDPEQPFTVNFSNPSGASISLAIYKENYEFLIDYRTVTGGSYTFNLTTQEKNAIYNLIPNQNQVKLNIRLRTNESGNYYFHHALRTFRVTNANPIFSNFTFADINSQTIALTGNNQTIIKGYSNVKGTVSVANKMTAVKGATENKYQLVIGDKQGTVNYSADSDVSITLNAIDNNVFMMYAIDSRNNSTVKQLSPATYIPYTEVKKGTTEDNQIYRIDNVSENVNLKIKGTFNNINFGAAENDVKAYYRYKKTTDTTWSDYTEIILTKTNNEYSFNGAVQGNLGASGFSVDDSFDIGIKVEDKLSSVIWQLILNSGKPNIAIHRKGTAFGAPYDEELEGFQIVDKKITFNGLELFKWVEEEEEE